MYNLNSLKNVYICIHKLIYGVKPALNEKTDFVTANYHRYTVRRTAGTVDARSRSTRVRYVQLHIQPVPGIPHTPDYYRADSACHIRHWAICRTSAAADRRTGIRRHHNRRTAGIRNRHYPLSLAGSPKRLIGCG